MSGNGHAKTVEDKNFNAIACENIPELFLDKIVAKKHFSKFGKIKRFILRPKRLSCIIEYQTKEEAKKAILNAGNYNGIDFFVSYAPNEVAHIQNTEEWVDPDVQAELEAMSAGNTTLKPYTKLNEMCRPSKYTNALCFPSSQSRQNSPQPEIPKVDAIIREELEAILKTPAITDEEKYRVLDARDKLLRLTTVRQTDINKAVPTKGTCPDMCPEKERLMREFQRQVSIFEMAEDDSKSTISHYKAVKEYSRSSADQEVPLSHELRSESVLEMTMIYLMHNIVELCDDPKTSLCDWFHFLWDRTRSIRKDITQQELCSLGAVQLVEQCARFHIHCGARLVAEDPSVFDKKINAENLTKCLQTLKYMYHDLRLKGIVCPREAEFRSYVILLNLGDSNFLWEVKQLPELIQKSMEIKRAIAFYNALQNNNFVKFFSMVRSPETSYLSACILLGYFTKLRVRALDAIIKSHNWRKNDVFLPLSYMTSILGFDNESSIKSFLNHYGLHCNIVDNHVLLHRLNKPNIEYAMTRALKLVESKRHISVGECVFGQTLPPATSFINHQPQNSFDTNGMLIERFNAHGHGMKPNTNTIIQHKYQREQPDVSELSINETCLFKIPHTISDISPKQHRKSYQQKFNKEYAFDSFIVPKKINSSPFGLIVCDNICRDTVTSSSTKEPFFTLPLSNIKSEIYLKTHVIRKPDTETHLNTTGNTFGVVSTTTQSKNKKCSTDGQESVNIFHECTDTPKDSFQNHNKLEEVKESTPLSVYGGIASEPALSSFKPEKEQSTLKHDIQNKIHIAAIDQNEKSKQNREEGKLRNLELNNLREKQKEQEYHITDINKSKISLNKKAEQSTELFIFNIIEEEIFKIAQTELVFSQTIIIACEMQNKHLITEVVKVLAEDIAKEEYALMCYDQLLLNRYFKRWLMYLRKKKEQKLIENTPLWITTDTRAQCVQAISHPSQQKNMEIIKRYRLGQPIDVNDVLKKEYSNLFEENENHLNLFALVGQHLLTKRNFTACGLLEQRTFFKFLITIPGNKEELMGFESFLNKWLMKIVEKSQIGSGPFVLGIERNVALCVRKINGIIPRNEQGNEMTTEGDHNDGVVCFITGTEIDTHSRQRLYNLLKLTKNLKRVPLAIIAYNCNCNEEYLAALLGLDVLQEQGLIYSYLILGCQVTRKDFNFRELFIKSVDFITSESYSLNSNEIQALAMQDVLTFLETSLGEEMWQRWLNSTWRNPVFNKVCYKPEHVVGIFHKALDHLIHITQADFDEMPEFPEELRVFVSKNLYSNVPLGLEYFNVDWKDIKGKTVIKRFLQSLHLPNIEENVPDDIEELKLWILNYTSKFIKDDHLSYAKASHEAITSLVNQIKIQCYNKVELSSSVRMINYLTVFKPIVFAQINIMLKHFKRRLADLKVIYLKDELKNYQTQSWWLNYEPLNFVALDQSEITLNLPQKLQSNYKRTCVSSDEVEKILAKAVETSHKAEECISELRRKKQEKIRYSLENLSSTSQLKRNLDDSLYQFELHKKVGQYDTSFVTELTEDIDKAISKVLNQSSLSIKKRKLTSLKSPNECSNIENDIAKQTEILQNSKSEKNKFCIKK